MELTNNEIKILKAARDSEYGNVFDNEPVWCFSVIEGSGLDPKVARGVISSLVKKGVAYVDDYGSRNKSDDMIFSLDEKYQNDPDLISMIPV